MIIFGTIRKDHLGRMSSLCVCLLCVDISCNLHFDDKREDVMMLTCLDVFVSVTGEGWGGSCSLKQPRQTDISTQSSWICQTTPTEKTHYPCLVLLCLLYLEPLRLRVMWQSGFSFSQVFTKLLELLGVFSFKGAVWYSNLHINLFFWWCTGVVSQTN